MRLNGLAASIVLCSMLLRNCCRKWKWIRVLITSSRKCHSFGPITITDDLLLRINSKNITKPTEIQEKALKPVLNGKDVIINSETGSGKTLCYLLPIIMNLEKSKKFFQDKLISSSRAVIFAPTTELLHQIGSVCNDLGINDVYVTHDGEPLCINETTQLIVTTPKFLMNYDWQRIKNINHIVFDEADLMFISQLKEVRKLFEFYTGCKVDFSRKEAIRRRKRESKRKFSTSRYEKVPQFVFAGATMPSGGRKTIISLVQRFVPRVELIQTEMVHRTIKDTKFDFIDMEEDFDTKTVVLSAILERELRVSECHLTTEDSVHDQNFNPFRAIIYVNKVSDAERLFHTLNIEKAEAKKLTQKFSGRSQQTTLNFTDAYSDKASEFDLKAFMLKWQGTICFLCSSVSDADRISMYERFSSGRYNVMITTGLGARGIDIPNVNVVIQFDFALNVADILHRAGRTGRAGAEGKVISFIAEKNHDLHKLFCAAIDKDNDITHLFSRKRRLRRRINEGKFLDIGLGS